MREIWIHILYTIYKIFEVQELLEALLLEEEWVALTIQ